LHFDLIIIHSFTPYLFVSYFCIVEAAAKKGGKAGKKDRSPPASAKKGSPKAGGKKGKKGN
jgi:hypothetical protein